MGVNNKARRAAKKRKQRVAAPRPERERFIPEVTPELARQHIVEMLAVIDSDPAAAEPLAEQLLRPDGLIPPVLALEALSALLASLTTKAVTHGWGPSDLANIVTRRLSEASVPTIVALLTAEAARHPSDRVQPAWLDDLAACGVPAAVELRDVATVRSALEVATCLATLPPIAPLLDPPGTRNRVGDRLPHGDAKMLAKVRSLLAKAESTEFDEEAEALTAKAQELISRHALEQLLDHQDQPQAMGARRVWIDAPYVFAKALLVAAVAEANRCRSVISEELGFCTVLGNDSDLASVDVLVTSLLVQASTAMRRHGRQVDRTGTSRTRSFRQSFLVAYAGRIRERLHTASDEAIHDTGRAGELVPVLHRQAEQVDAAVGQMFPHLVTRGAAIGNAQGWAAGRAAADLAQLDTDQQITTAAS